MNTPDVIAKTVRGQQFWANTAERSFAREVEAAGKTWIFQPRQFPLPEPHRSYRPDFYVIEDNCFYEVVATRQAYSYNRTKIAAFRAAYPHLRLEIINKGAWDNGPSKRVRVAEPKRQRRRRGHALGLRLAVAKANTPAALIRDALAAAGGFGATEFCRLSGFNYNRLTDASRNRGLRRAGGVERLRVDLLEAVRAIHERDKTAPAVLSAPLGA